MKGFLSQQGIAFEERNVHRDPAAAAQLRALMGRSVFPVVQFDDEEVVVGAKLDRIRELHQRRLPPG